MGCTAIWLHWPFVMCVSSLHVDRDGSQGDDLTTSHRFIVRIAGKKVSQMCFIDQNVTAKTGITDQSHFFVISYTSCNMTNKVEKMTTAPMPMYWSWSQHSYQSYQWFEYYHIHITMFSIWSMRECLSYRIEIYAHHCPTVLVTIYRALQLLI